MQALLRTLTFGVVLTLVVSVVSLSAQERDPRIGVWKLNVAQSTFDPGPPPQSMTRTFEDRGGGVTLLTLEGINAQGKPIFEQTAYKFDGKDYPLATIGAQTVATFSYKLVDAYTVEFIGKEGWQGRLDYHGHGVQGWQDNDLPYEGHERTGVCL